MRVRDFEQRDTQRVADLFNMQGFEYIPPDLSGFLVAQVLVDENDIPVMALGAKQTVEMFLLCDPTWRSPKWRWEGLKLIHETMRQALAKLGIDEAHFWAPPEIERSFGRRLMKYLGWKKQLWASFGREVNG